RLEAGKARLGDGRDLGQYLRSLERRDREWANCAALDVREQRRGRIERHRDVSADDRLQRRPGASERHMRDVDLGFEFEHLAGEMRRRAVAARAEAELARIGFGVGFNSASEVAGTDGLR